MSAYDEAPPGDDGLLRRLLAITHDILQARDTAPAVESIAHGFAEAFQWRYVTIVAADEPGGELRRRVMIGYGPDVISARMGEVIPQAEIAEFLQPSYEVFPNCFYIAAELGRDTEHSIYAGDLPRNAPREAANHWHERDTLVLVLADRDGKMLGYLSPDHPLDGKAPTKRVLREMQIFVNLIGLALANTRAHDAAVERRRLVEDNARLQNDFFSMVAHEVRSPLAAIRGATALFETHLEQLEPERRADLLSVLSSSTARLSAIFEDFLLLSRMDAGQLSLRFEAIDPISVVEESVARTESEHPDREFQTVYLAPLPRVYADEGRVVQVLANFLSNAVKYSLADSVVTIEIKAHDDAVLFTVSNAGTGIPKEDHDKLFTRFGRLALGDGSTGLGLYICKQLVALMNGSIGFDSAPGRRTSFWFKLPQG
jgi:signal transduction histidine kinase